MLNVFTLSNGRLFQEEIESLESLSRVISGRCRLHLRWLPIWNASVFSQRILRR